MHSRTARALWAHLGLLGSLVVALSFAAPMAIQCAWTHGRPSCVSVLDRPGETDDVRSFLARWEAARVSLVDFHQFPSWNPYHCGGIVLYQDAETPFPGPLFLLTFFWLSSAAALKLWIAVHYVAGALGARRLALDMGANPPEQTLAAALAVGCGFCALHFGGGHLSFTPFLLLPWILWAHRRALADARWAVLVAALFALALYEGGTYPVPLLFVVVVVDTLTRLDDPRARRGAAVSLAVFAALFPLLAAARLVPLLYFLRTHPRLMPLDDQMTVAEVLSAWLTRAHDRAFAGHAYVWPEYGDYVGAAPVALLGVGLAATFLWRDGATRERRREAVLLGAMVWCALGNVPGFSLWGLLHELPIYRSLRVPSRFLYPATVALALVAVRALVDLRSAAARGWRPRLARAVVVLEVALVVGVAVDLGVVNGPWLQQGRGEPLPSGVASARFRQVRDADYARLPTHPQRGIGTTECYTALDWQPSRLLWTDAEAQQRLDPPRAGVVESRAWSPSALSFRVALERPATLLIDQNYDAGWGASRGRVAARDGLLTVELPAGRYDLAVRHRPQGLGLGVALAALGAVLSALTAWWLTPARVAAGARRLRASLAARPPEAAVAQPR